MIKTVVAIAFFIFLPRAFSENYRTVKTDAIAGINALLMLEKTGTPTVTDNDIYYRFRDILLINDDLKSLEALSKMSKEKHLTCASYADGDLLPRLSKLVYLGKKLNSEIIKEESWQKGIHLSKMWLALGSCNSLIAYRAVGMALLEDSVNQLLSLPAEKMTSSEAFQLQNLKKEIEGYSTKVGLKDALYQEIVYFISMMVNEDLSNGNCTLDLSSIKMFTEAGLYQVIELLWPDLKSHFQWSLGAKPIATVFNSIEDEEELSEERLIGLVKKEENNYLQELISAIRLDNQGINAYDDLKNENKVSELILKLKSNRKVLNRKYQMISYFPASALFTSLIIPAVTQQYVDVLKKVSKKHLNISVTLNKIEVFINPCSACEIGLQSSSGI